MQRSATGWKLTLLLFFVTSVIESYGYSHLGAFLPVATGWASRKSSIAFAVNIPASALLGFSHHLAWFGLLLTVHSASVIIGGAMIFALLSTRIPESHRSTALNLVYLPLYLGGIAGPLLASGLTHFGVIGPFSGAAVVSVIGYCLVLYTVRRKESMLARNVDVSTTPG
jgi:hypothetical protein